jgi:predicted CoA-binding protein
MTDPQADIIRHILTQYRTVAVVGFSDRDRRKPAFYAPAYLKGHGYTILPVNPRLEIGLGRPAYPTLADVPGSVDVALIYAGADRVGPFVDQAIAIGAKAVWLPTGVVEEAAAARARAAGLLVVMDRCMMVEHKHLESDQAES